MDNWFILTDRKIEENGHTLRLFVYTKDVMDKKAGDFGCYVEDETSLQYPFSTDEKTKIYGSSRIMTECSILGSIIGSGTVISGNILIKNSTIENVFIDIECKAKTKCYKREIINSQFISNGSRIFVDVYGSQSSFSIRDSQFIHSFSSQQKHFGESKIVVKNTGRFLLWDSVLETKEDFAFDTYSFGVFDSKITGRLNISDKNIVLNISNSNISGSVIGTHFSIVDSNIAGSFSHETKDIFSRPGSVETVVLKNCKLSEDSFIIKYKNKYKSTFQNITLTGTSSIVLNKNAEETHIENAILTENASITISEGKHTIKDIEMEQMSSIDNTDVYNSKINKNVFITNVTIKNSTIGQSNVLNHIKIGLTAKFAEIPKDFSSIMVFDDVKIKNNSDFLCTCIDPNNLYYFLVCGTLYKASRNSDGTVSFVEVSSVSEFDNFFSNALMFGSEQVFFNNGANIKALIYKSKKWIKNNKNNLSAFYSDETILTLFNLAVLRFLYLSTNNMKTTQKTYQLSEDPVGKILNFLTYDFKNKKPIGFSDDVVLLPYELSNEKIKQIKCVFI